MAEKKKIKLSKLKCNERNPRIITDAKLEKLTDSILVFPQMLELRPIVCDKEKVLGGNMRTKALKNIAKMPVEYIAERLSMMQTYKDKTEEEKAFICDFWEQWLKTKEVTIETADDLTEAQKDEFILKDNADFGKWDFDMLQKDWDEKKFEEWGVDVIFESDVDIDDFFDTLNNDEEKAEHEVIIVSIPLELREKKDEIIGKIKESIKEYDGVKVK